jgi:putative tricarboxylic transport membrane protein
LKGRLIGNITDFKENKFHKMERGNIVVIFVLEGLGIWIIFDSYRLGVQTVADPGSGLFPLLLGVLLCLSVLPYFISSLKYLMSADKIKEEKSIEYRANLKRLSTVMVYLVGYALLLDILGFLITTFLFLVGLFWIGNPRRWLLVFGFSLIATILSYLIFDILLQMPFPTIF